MFSVVVRLLYIALPNWGSVTLGQILDVCFLHFTSDNLFKFDFSGFLVEFIAKTYLRTITDPRQMDTRHDKH